jgi:hypothetical protein
MAVVYFVCECSHQSLVNFKWLGTNILIFLKIHRKGFGTFWKQTPELGFHPVAVAQYTFTHKQYMETTQMTTEQHK